ncbi:type II secretion system F family protein [Ostreibacterium oceani]|uniref:Type II secretion system F family protein n=1 Tax=Ostreibacterium oceani TaxID=2654998 RepID=A0A6N7EVZ7_9GAMM|nr:type II secretion system F family protein [Ostreibacterium oceani]MPV85730.1 type II secretion system F family protein [Ostreibacterium oceani]
MRKFNYRASNQHGDMVKGHVEAADEQGVVEHIKSQGLIPLNIKKASNLAFTLNQIGRQSIDDKVIAVFTMELATLLEAGLSLDRSLSILIEMEESPPWRMVLEDILAKVKSGQSLSQAMQSQNAVFSESYVGLVHAGELSGSLVNVLEQLSEYIEKQLETRAAVKKALFYPILLLIVGVGVVLYLMFSVVPIFAEMIEKNQTDPPFISDIIFVASYGLTNYWYVFLMVILMLAAYIQYLLRSPQKKRWRDQRLINSRLLGDLVRSKELAIFSRTLGTMLTNGVPLAIALRSVKSAMGNQVLSEAVESGLQSLKSGRGMANVLIASGQFPTMGVQMIRVGEETGKLEKMLLKVADLYDKEVRDKTDAIVAKIAPLSVLCIAAVVVFIMLGVIFAIFSLS